MTHFLSKPSARRAAPAQAKTISDTRMHGFAALLLVTASMTSLAQAQSRFEEDFDDKGKSWQEVALQLPAFPQTENLLNFFVSQLATQSFAIDAKSLSLGSDGVIRYTLVATSASGAKSVSYEGIRCASFEAKLYAFGHQDKTWARARRDEWEPIQNNAANRQQAALALDYFCQGHTVGGKPDQMIERIRSKRPFN